MKTQLLPFVAGFLLVAGSIAVAANFDKLPKHLQNKNDRANG